MLQKWDFGVLKVQILFDKGTKMEKELFRQFQPAVGLIGSKLLPNEVSIIYLGILGREIFIAIWLSESLTIRP